MTDTLQPYPEYKDSGSRWLTTVPSHWKVHNLRTLIRHRNERNRPDLPLLSVAREKGVFVRSLTDENENHNIIPEDLSNYKVARAGNLVINKMKAWQGSMGIAPCDGIVSPAYFVYDFSIANRSFGQVLLRSKPYVAHFGQASDGVRVGQWDLTISGMRQIPVLVPPPDEQAAIVRFLDHANGRIERAIRAKRKIITLLTEQKQAIIASLVTGKCEVRRVKGEEGRGKGEEGRVKGEDGSDISLFTPRPSHFMKSSGIPWLGDIPAHWEVRRLRFCTKGKLTYGANAAAEFDNPTWPRYLRITDFNGDGSLRPDTFRSLPPEVAKDYLVEDGDILFARSGATVGKAFLVRTNTVKACYAGYLIRARPNTSIVLPEYLFAFTQSTAFLRWKDAIFIKATIQNIGADKYANLAVPTPPIDEQQAILDYIETEIAPLRTAISNLEREIALLREYRTRLTADVVTGKLDVRREKCEERRVKGEGDWGKEDEAEAMETEEGGEDE